MLKHNKVIKKLPKKEVERRLEITGEWYTYNTYWTQEEPLKTALQKIRQAREEVKKALDLRMYDFMYGIYGKEVAKFLYDRDLTEQQWLKGIADFDKNTEAYDEWYNSQFVEGAETRIYTQGEIWPKMYIHHKIKELGKEK